MIDYQHPSNHISTQDIQDILAGIVDLDEENLEGLEDAARGVAEFMPKYQVGQGLDW